MVADEIEPNDVETMSRKAEEAATAIGKAGHDVDRFKTMLEASLKDASPTRTSVVMLSGLLVVWLAAP